MSMPYGAKLTNPQVKQILSRYSGGETSFKLARAFGVSPAAVRGIARRNGVCGGRKPKIDMAVLRQMVERGERRVDMVDYFDVSDAAIHKALRRLERAA